MLASTINMFSLIKTEDVVIIELPGRVPSLKNDRVQFIIQSAKPRAMSVVNQEYKAWYTKSRDFIHSKLKEDLYWTHVHVEILVFFGNKVGADLPNAVDSIMDLLRDCNIVWNDTYYCVSTNSNTAIYRKNEPGCLIKIERKKNEFFNDN